MTPKNVNGKRKLPNPNKVCRRLQRTTASRLRRATHDVQNGAPGPAEARRGHPYNQRALKLMIVGCGRVGSQIAADMDKSGHDVIIIDRDPNQFSRAASRGVLTGDFKGDQVVGNGTDADVLRRAGIEDADGFVAVTEGDNRNIMAAQIAKHVFKVPRVVARIYDPERAEAYEKLGLHTICPTIEGAKHIEKTLLDNQ
jgi:trk system potassium uptake protein TrkA